MKNIAKLFLMTLAVATMATACGEKTTSENAAGSAAGTETTETAENVTRGANSSEKAQRAQMFSSALLSTEQASRFSLDQLPADFAVASIEVMEAAQADDEDIAASIYGSLVTAEKEAAVLDIQFAMSEETVEDGIFVFSMESQDEKNLTLEMFDEEGYELAANNLVQVTTGKNYRALNVTKLPSGTYIFKLVDNDSGAELVRTVNIINE